MSKRSTATAWAAIGTAFLIGEASLLAFMVFLFRGPFNLIVLDVSTPAALGIDAVLCLLFFVQHSGMIRKTFRTWLGRFVPAHLHGALYTVASGAGLLVLVLLWQPTAPILVSAEGFLRWLLRGLFLAAILGSVWGIRALGSFDAFGIHSIKAFLGGKEVRDLPLTIRGPYKWVRHPLYTICLVMMWCYPDYTADRLLFNTMWTLWVILGSVLEERDLAAAFGQPYRDYQKDVPMLIPWRISKNR